MRCIGSLVTECSGLNLEHLTMKNRKNSLCFPLMNVIRRLGQALWLGMNSLIVLIIRFLKMY